MCRRLSLLAGVLLESASNAFVYGGGDLAAPGPGDCPSSIDTGAGQPPPRGHRGGAFW